MAKKRSSTQFTLERTYTVRRPELKPFKTIQYLDTAKLAKGSHTIEVGTVEGCDSAVTATIRNGMVTGFEIPKCGTTAEVPSIAADKLQAARRELAASGPKWDDIPVDQFIRMSAAGMIIVVTPDGEGCVTICVQTSGGEVCFMCCPEWPEVCIGPSEPSLSLF
jgi:hypothetical protein